MQAALQISRQGAGWSMKTKNNALETFLIRPPVESFLKIKL